MESIPSWSDLPLDLLGLVIIRLPYPADRARFRAVCLSWHSAVRRHGQQLPWIFSPHGKVGTLSDDGSSRCLPSVSDTTTCFASSDDWLVLAFFHTSENKYHIDSYLLHNEFSNTSIPLPELESILHGHQRIRRFRVRSTGDGLVIAAITTNENYPLVVIRPGKGVWSPEPQAQPYIYIVDIAFLGDTLYAVTQAEDLITLSLTSDADGKPMVTIGKRVIRQPLEYNGYGWWPGSDDDEEEGVIDDDDDDDADQEEEDAGVDGDTDDEQEEEGAAALSDDDDDDDDYYDDDDDEEDDDEEDQASEDGNDIESNINYLSSSEYTSDDKIIHRHLIESCGKLLMVRPHMCYPPDESILSTCSVDVFEADMDTSAWVPLVNGLGGGRALFVGLNFSKSVSAPRGEVEEDTIYFIESGDVFNMKTATGNLETFCDPWCWGVFPNFLFPPELVL